MVSLKKGRLIVKTMRRPEKPTAAELAEWDEFDKSQFKERDRDFMRLKNKTYENLTTLQSVLWGQCDEAVQSKVKAHPDYDEDVSDIFELMNILWRPCAKMRGNSSRKCVPKPGMHASKYMRSNNLMI